jgi:hypothetical protein
MFGQGAFVAHLLDEVAYLRERVRVLEDRLWSGVPMAIATAPEAIAVMPAPPPFPPEVQDAIDSRAEEDQDTRRLLETFAKAALVDQKPTAVAAAILRGQDVDEV